MAPGRLDELPRVELDQIREARVGHLGLIDDDGRPRVLPVTFAVCGDALVSAIDHKPKRVAPERLARVRWLRRDPRAALTVDRYEEDWSRLAWVQAIGTAEVLDEPPPGAVEALQAKYEQYRDRPPEGPFVVLRPERFASWKA
jgi:PPOX class probable F420-dependent enzyme